METIKQDFAAILKIEKELSKFTGTDHLDQYFKIQAKLKEALVQFLRKDFTVLSKKQFLKLCCLVSSHRPVAPFSFLVSIGMNVNK